MVGLIPPEDAGIMFADASDPHRPYYSRFSGVYARHLVDRILAKHGSRKTSTHNDILSVPRKSADEGTDHAFPLHTVDR